MVVGVGATMTIQQVPSKGRMSIMRIQNFTVQKRQSDLKLIYGIMLVIIASTMAALNPIQVFTNWYMDIKEGSFLFNMWASPTYELFSEVWVYNYTNVPQYLSGEENKLRLQEIGPFIFQEFRTNENLTIDRERGVMTMKPRIELKFLEDESIADPNDLNVNMPNIALIAISTLAADKLGYFANAGAYYSITALGSKLFRNLTVEEVFWGYEDPIVTIANQLLPNWIDFGKIGILDRFYAQKDDTAEVELKNQSKRYSVNTWNNSPGLVEQGFTDLNSSIPCNRIQGTYEGLMLSSNFPKGKEIPIYRAQACRIYPFEFQQEEIGYHGLNYYKYTLAESAFSRKSPYACQCTVNCVPEGFVDVNQCYYGFPITLSKPHFLDTDPEQVSYFGGMKPDRQKHGSYLHLQPNMGIPLALAINIQVNIAVRMSPGNPITEPIKDKVMPILWLSLHCRQPPPEVLSLLRLRIVIAPPLVITIEVLLFIIGFIIGIQGFYRIIKPSYKIIERRKVRKINVEKPIVRSNIAENSTFMVSDEVAREAVSLLAIKVDDSLICD